MKTFRPLSFLFFVLAGSCLAQAAPETPASTPCYDPLGAFQSPIDFNTPDGCFPSFYSSSGCRIFTAPHYASETLRFTVTYSGAGTPDQNIKFYNAAPGSVTLLFQQTVYYLTEFHFHSPSEHTFSGPPRRDFQMELHLVFRPTPDPHDSLPGIVIGVPIMVSSGPATLFNNHLSALLSGNLADGTTLAVPSALFTSCLSYHNTWNFPPSYVYPGSLTTAPYGEGITWIVLNGHVAQTAVIVQSTLDRFLALRINGRRIGGSRPVQKLYSRPLITVTPP